MAPDLQLSSSFIPSVRATGAPCSQNLTTGGIAVQWAHFEVGLVLIHRNIMTRQGREAGERRGRRR
jgi:hypothetical protein